MSDLLIILCGALLAFTLYDLLRAAASGLYAAWMTVSALFPVHAGEAGSLPAGPAGPEA